MVVGSPTVKKISMATSSIHIAVVKVTSESHNKRTTTLSYVRIDKTIDNSQFIDKSIAEARSFIEANYLSKVKQKMQKSMTPIREGVLNIEEHHTAEDLRIVGQKIEERFGIKTIQAYAHKDEGHYNVESGVWKPNFHGHMVFDWTNHQTGRTIKLSQDDMSEMQTIVAESLGMARGVKSTKIHIETSAFKAMKQQDDLKKIETLSKKAKKELKYIETGVEAERYLDMILEKGKNMAQNQLKLTQVYEHTRNELKDVTGSVNIKKSELSVVVQDVQNGNDELLRIEAMKKALEEKLRMAEKKVLEAEQKAAAAEERASQIEQISKNLETKTGLQSANLRHIERKTEEKREELNQIDTKIIQKQGPKMGR